MVDDKSTNDAFPKDYFKRQKFVLKFLGISLSNDEGYFYKVYQFIVIFFMMVVYFVFHLHGLFSQEWDIVVKWLTFVFAFFSAIYKELLFLFNSKKIANLMERLEQPPLKPDLSRGGKTEIELIKECNWIVNAQTTTYYAAVVGSITITISYALSKRLRSNDYHDWEFAYGPLTVINTTYSPNFEILFVLQNISVCIYAFVFSTVDLVSAGLLAHMFYQFKILQNYIRRMIKKTYQEELRAEGLAVENIEESTIDVSLIPWKYFRNTIQEIISYHLHIMKFVSEVENLIGYFLLTEFLCTLGVLCFTVNDMAMVSYDNPRLYTRLMELFCGSMQVVLICYWGEQIKHESQEVARAVYDINFIGADLQFQKALIMIMVRSQKPVGISAAGLVNVNLATFTWIMRTSYSAFMIVRNKS